MNLNLYIAIAAVAAVVVLAGVGWIAPGAGVSFPA